MKNDTNSAFNSKASGMPTLGKLQDNVPLPKEAAGKDVFLSANELHLTSSFDYLVTDLATRIPELDSRSLATLTRSLGKLRFRDVQLANPIMESVRDRIDKKKVAVEGFPNRTETRYHTDLSVSEICSVIYGLADMNICSPKTKIILLDQLVVKLVTTNTVLSGKDMVDISDAVQRLQLHHLPFLRFLRAHVLENFEQYEEAEVFKLGAAFGEMDFPTSQLKEKMFNTYGATAKVKNMISKIGAEFNALRGKGGK
jgi:hypothetical protein